MNRSPATALGGIAYVVLAGACFAILDTVTQYVILTVPVLMALWVRYLLQAVISTAVLLPLHGRRLFHTRHPKLQMLRGLLLTTSTTLAFFGLRVMSVGEFTAIVMVTPLAVTVLAVTVLKEKIAPLHWLFIVGGFAGAMIIIRPGGQRFGWSALIPLACMVASSVFQLVSSHLGKTEKPATTHFYTGWVGASLSTLLLPLTWVMVDSPRLWLLLLFMGTMGALGHFVLALAYQRAPASRLMPYLYCQLGFAVLAGWLAFSHVPDKLACLGIGLIAVNGVCGAWLTAREHRLPTELPES